MATCPNFDNEETDPSKFFDGSSINWKRHYIGWAIAGVCAVISTVISFRLLYKHARNYNKPSEQRHIMRIVLMIPIYAVVSFLSYRFYKEAIYYETVRDCYEAFVIYSFFVLLLTYLGDDTESRKARLSGSERKKLIFPLNCFYYNPQGELFLHKIKYGVLQYVVLNPILTIAAVVLQYKGLYCDTTYSFAFGKVYITIINFVSVTVAMYCLVIFYMNIKTEIADKKPFMKFLCVKLVIFFCFWQTCLLSLLGDLNVFKATEYWSVSNIEIGISALMICVEMVIFSILHVYSFSYAPYVSDYNTPVRKSLRDGFNPMDLVKEVGWACKDISLIIMGRSPPIREQHLSGAVKRASTIRAKNRLHWKNGDNDGGNVTPGTADSLADSSSLEAGGKFGGRYIDTQLDAPLLSNVDYAHTINNQRQNMYEMQQQQQQQQQYQQQQQQYQQQQLQQQQYQQQHQQQQQQQLQQQQAFASRPADSYQQY